MSTGADAPSRLSRRLPTADAVVIGLGSMIGASVFAAFGPAARAAGNGLLLGLAIAALVADCNATSSAQLAALYPESGSAYRAGGGLGRWLSGSGSTLAASRGGALWHPTIRWILVLRVCGLCTHRHIRRGSGRTE